MAVNKCTQRFRMLYRSLPGTTHPPSPAEVLWPNPTADPPQSAGWSYSLEIPSRVGRLLGTRLKAIISEANKHHPMYAARSQIPGDTSTSEVLVKFTAKYNEAAHRLLAPALHYCMRHR